MTSVLTTLSESIAEAVDQAGASIVRVEARRRLPASGIVRSSDGLILTAHHVVERDEGIQIGLPDGNKVGGTVVGRDPNTDLALLKADTTGLKAPDWADASDLRVGHLSLALGRPDEKVLATLGIVSAIGGRRRSRSDGRTESYIQPDVVMYPGFSGGPLVDTEGKFIGINTSALRGGGPVTVPVATIRRVVDSLLQHGRVRRGYLGVGAQPTRLPEAIAQQLEQRSGLLLVSVEPDSPAEKAGLYLGDVIVSLDGQATRRVNHLLNLLGEDSVGQKSEVRVLRSGELLTVSAIIGERE